jgi:hypothetical protein
VNQNFIANGIPLDSAAVENALAGYKRADIADPFGNRIELMQRV